MSGGVGRFGLRSNGVEILQFAVGGLQGELSFISLFNPAKINFPTLFPGASTTATEPAACMNARSTSPEVHLSILFSLRNLLRNASLPEFGDALLSLLLIFNCVSRCYIGLASYAKQIKTMRWVYFLEGISFVLAANLVAPQFGMPGIILMAILANLVWSGSYGVRWAKGYFDVSVSEILGVWFGPAFRYLLIMLVLTTSLCSLNFPILPIARLAIKAAATAAIGTSLLWFTGLCKELRAEAKGRLRSFR